MTAPNAELAYRVLDQIDAHPESWDQNQWWTTTWPSQSCGTAGCFAGWTLALAGEQPKRGGMGWVAADGTEIPDRAALLLGFESRGRMDAIIESVDEDKWLFHSDNTREDVGWMVEMLFGPRPAVSA